MPLLLTPSWAASSDGDGFLAVVSFVVSTIFFAFVITWVFNNTQASLLLAMLVHASAATFSLNGIFPAPVAADNLSSVSGFGAVAVVLVVFTRGRLGYQHYRQEDPELASHDTKRE